MFGRNIGQMGRRSGDGVIPFESEAAAFEWAQKELTTEEVEEHFGHLIEEA